MILLNHVFVFWFVILGVYDQNVIAQWARKPLIAKIPANPDGVTVFRFPPFQIDKFPEYVSSLILQTHALITKPI